MKAAEVLRLYEKGERDFKGVSLRGQNFKGKDLSGADFSGADIRSTDFTNANLTGANFAQATAGLQKRWAAGIVVSSLLTSTILEIFSGFVGATVNLLYDSGKPQNQIVGWASLAVAVIFLFLLLCKGFRYAVIGVAVIAPGVIAGLSGAGLMAIGRPISIALAITIAGFGVVIVAVAIAVVTSIAVAGTVAGTVALSISISIAGFITGIRAVAIALVVAVALVSAYIGWRAFKGDERDAWIRSVAIAFAAIGGSSFRGATLTDADFSQACLKSTDFRRAVLRRTCWRDAEKLDRVRPGETYLNNSKIRELVLTGNGQGQSYDHLLNLSGINLQGANLFKADFTGSNLSYGVLQGANLANTSFIGANLNCAYLQEADLSDAKLVQTQLDVADLTGSTLTGAYIEDWGITTRTKLDGIRCDYVFMRLPSERHPDPNPRRKPDDWNKTFADGEFSDFIAPMVETLDLYHNQAVDPRAVAIAYHDLQQNHPEAEMEIVSMEKRGKNRDKLLLRAETDPQADLSELNSQYFERYDYLLTLPPEALQALLIEKDKQVKMLARMVDTAIDRPSQTFVSQYHNQGDVNMSEQGSNAPKYDLRNAQFAGGFAETVKGDQVGGTINNQASKTPSLAEAAAEIQALLKQLEQTAPAETMTEKMTLATQAIAQIEANPTFKQRAVAALTAGGMKAFESAIDHPVAAFVVGAIDEWKKS
ncbi:pentapeptide repeat-containing protein [Leptothoe sp. ISB3NOV94-8A]